MNRMRGNIIVGSIVLIVGCSHGQWVKEGDTAEEREQAMAECQSLSLTHVPSGTLSEKIGGNPDLNTIDFERCMRNHGYKWVTDDGNPGKKEK